MKIYLAGSSKEAARVRTMAGRVADLGLTLTTQWWEPEAYGAPEQWAGNDGCLSRDLQRHIARSQMRAIKDSQVFWVLWPDHGLRSTCEGELCYAYSRQGENLAVVVTGERSHECVWTALADYRDADDLCGLAEVARLAVGARRTGMRGTYV